MKTFLKSALICLCLFNLFLSQEMNGMSTTMNPGLNDTAPTGRFDQYIQLLTGILGNGTLGMLQPNNETDAPSPADQQGLCGVSVNTTSLSDIISPTSLSDCTYDKKSAIGKCCQIKINTNDFNVNVCGVLTDSNVKSLNKDEIKVLFTAYGIQAVFTCSAVKLVSSVLLNIFILFLLI